MKKKILLISSLTSFFSFIPSVLIACQKNNFIINKAFYVEKNNFANDYKDFSYLEDNFISKNIQNINLATASKLIRIESKKNPIIDFRDNIVLFPSELSYKFEWAKEIEIDNKKFINDSVDLVSYDNEETNNKKGIFRPKKDKGNGFNSPFLFVPSSDTHSINSPIFKESLLNAKSIKIKIEPKENVWIDYLGKKIVDGKIDANSFKLYFLAKMLKNKIYRESVIKEKKIKIDNKFKEINDNTDGFDLVTYFRNNNIDLNKLLDSKDDEIVIESINHKSIDFSSLFENIFILQNYFDTMPYEWLKNKYGLNELNDFKKNLNWFFEYGKTYKDRFYASSYIINHMDNNETVLKINNNYFKNKNYNDSNLEKISIQYNPLFVSNSTFSLQATNAFKQNIISKLEYESLNLNEKQEILKNFRNYNFSYQKNNNRFRLNNSIIINQSPNLDSPYFNRNFLKLFYGLNETGKYELKKENLVFQSLFNNLINLYGIVEGNNDVWLSQAPENLYIDAKNKSLNVNELKDIFNQISKPIIIDSQSKRIENVFQYQNKQKIRDPRNISNKKKLESIKFEQIKKNIEAIIDNFYGQSNNDEDIFVNIPILIINENQDTLQKIKYIKEILNSIYNKKNKKLKVELSLIDNFEKYNEFFKLNKSIYKDFSFRLFEGNSSEYLVNQITNSKSNLDKLINAIRKDSNLGLIYQEISKLDQSLVSNKEKLRTYLKNLDVENQLIMINEINNLLSYTINFNNQVNIDNFSKVVYQKHLIKSIGWNDLNYFQDIKVEREA
ncbi:OppA family ABC transporter substrate-binding lipoprotein [Metamycoplasma auris]|uniref:Lipoprotein n=1 Tax=Metamycoplasma auris TaxID=51363 RepID=A0A2W7FWG5_9BACT|nr:hypothetical protein [Metamycoplasma auris]PZV98719.1 hypothetical protein BCF89_11312 [Metamycoplasma auris]